MIIKIHSENKFLLDVLHKNPDTDYGLYVKELKDGHLIGNAVDKYHYEVLFYDLKGSYQPDESNQLDFQSLCSPLIILNATTELFNHLLKSYEEYNTTEIKWLSKSYNEVDTIPCTVEIPTFYIHSGWARNGEFLLCKYFKEIRVEHKIGNNYKLTISGNNIFHAINLLNLVALFTHITNQYGVFTFITDDFANKYVRVLTNIRDVPYFVFYLFIKKCIKSEKQFIVFKTQLEDYFKAKEWDVSLTYWDTHETRKLYILDKLDFNYSILDIGCGELQYFRRIINKDFSKNYYAVDEDETIEEEVEFQRRVTDFKHLYFYTSLEQLNIHEPVNIILTEVIEHNSVETAKELVQQSLKFDFLKFIITTPNSEFNQFYFDVDMMRHDDHDFEFNTIEFQSFIQDCISDQPKAYEIKFEQIGDAINGICPTQCCILTPAKN